MPIILCFLSYAAVPREVERMKLAAYSGLGLPFSAGHYIPCLHTPATKSAAGRSGVGVAFEDTSRDASRQISPDDAHRARDPRSQTGRRDCQE